MDWDFNALLGKARVFARRADKEDMESELFALWMSLTLELLCRASLAKIHPVLLADPKADGSVLYAFGVQPATNPRSIAMKALLDRCERLVEGFTKEMVEHCIIIADRRNAELHSGLAAFGLMNQTDWLTKTYEVMEVLLRHLNSNFEEFLGQEHAKIARGALKERIEAIHQQVRQSIAESREAYGALKSEEIDQRRADAEINAARLKSHSLAARIKFVKCPACGSEAPMTGDVVARGPVKIDEGQSAITREVRILPTRFRCYHCGLRIEGFQGMRFANLGSIYTYTEAEDPIEFFGIDPADYVDIDKLVEDYFQPDYDNE